MIEQILRDLASADNRWSIALLRYFNPIGAHKSGKIGENPNGISNNLLPYINQVAIGKLEKLSVFGGDYSTHDGTGIRDYIHVVDLARGHLASLDYLYQHNGCYTWNLGTGQGYSVLDIVKAFERASEKSIFYEITELRLGDVAECWSDSEKVYRELGWKAELSLKDMMVDTWRWQKNNPEGYN